MTLKSPRVGRDSGRDARTHGGGDEGCGAVGQVAVGPMLTWPGKERLDPALVQTVSLETIRRIEQTESAGVDSGLDSGLDSSSGSDLDVGSRTAFGRLLLGDNLAILASLRAELEGRIDLLYVDPPYGTGKKRRGTVRGTTTTARQGADDEVPEVAYEDPLADDPRYLDRMWLFFKLVAPLLSDRGQVFVHLDQRASALVRLVLDEVFGRRSFLNEIIWHYSSGGRAARFYARKSDSILWYAPQGGYRFYPDRLAQPRNRCWKCGSIVEDRNHMKRHRDGDGRVYRSIRSGGKRYRYYDDDPVAPSNVWLDIGHIQQKDPERMGYPTQKPETLLERILLGHSDENDLVADFFCGSGTTLAVAHRLGRSWIGCDSSQDAVEVSARRLEEQVRRCGGSMVLERAVSSPRQK